MNFNKYVKNNKLCLHYEKVKIKELVNFLQENKSITQLSLNDYDIDDKGAEALAKLNNLTTLDLSWNNIGDQGAKALAELKNLTTLDLAGNRIGKEGAEALAELKNLTTLDLAGNRIGKEGAEALAKLNSLTTLNLNWNNIGDQGAKALLNSDNFSKFKSLDFHFRNKAYSGNKVDILQKIENSKAVIIGSICGVIAALAVGVGCGIAGIGLSISAIAGIAVAAALVIGVIAGGVTYSVLGPSNKLDKSDSKSPEGVVKQQVKYP